ncbi:hypothetical protein [Enterobacter hormaechei]|uniref:hypothetical protein n=1 Tax=Enterobacter hormaechei TaxID=158836 RepID=UPI0032DAE214
MAEDRWEFLVALASECECSGDRMMAEMWWYRAEREARTEAERLWCRKRAADCRDASGRPPAR